MTTKRLHKSLHDKMIGGVCGGLGQYFEVDPTLIRIAWVAISLISIPAGLAIGPLAYLAAMLIIPRNPEEVTLMTDEPREEQEYKSNSLLWGVVLILLALVVLQRTDLLPFHFHWGRGNFLPPLVLIGVAIVLMLKYRPEMADKLRTMAEERRLYRSDTDKKLFGVCGGLAESFNIDPTLVRLAWAFGTMLSGGAGVVIYAVLAWVLPVGRPNTMQSS